MVRFDSMATRSNNSLPFPPLALSHPLPPIVLYALATFYPQPGYSVMLLDLPDRALTSFQCFTFQDDQPSACARIRARSASACGPRRRRMPCRLPLAQNPTTTLLAARTAESSARDLNSTLWSVMDGEPKREQRKAVLTAWGGFEIEFCELVPSQDFSFLHYAALEKPSMHAHHPPRTPPALRASSSSSAPLSVLVLSSVRCHSLLSRLGCSV
ncbi:hypothetical protein B0H11DRAFT_2182911 [Mycena galericulata]|nr:hypothetical protein B0H11DRAFT_2182911 [Mycena galericulata]